MTPRGGWRADIGRRGGVLLTLAAGDLAYGAAMLAGYAPASIAADIAPPATWGALWVTVAVLLTAAALSPADQAGYAIAALAKFGWAALILADGATHRTPGGWGPAVPWLTLAGLVLLTAAWPECPRR